MAGQLTRAAFAFVSKKAGYDLSPETDEQVTDAARGLYEKFSGYVMSASGVGAAAAAAAAALKMK